MEGNVKTMINKLDQNVLKPGQKKGILLEVGAQELNFLFSFSLQRCQMQEELKNITEDNTFM